MLKSRGRGSIHTESQLFLSAQDGESAQRERGGEATEPPTGEKEKGGMDPVDFSKVIGGRVGCRLKQSSK